MTMMKSVKSMEKTKESILDYFKIGVLFFMTQLGLSYIASMVFKNPAIALIYTLEQFKAIVIGSTESVVMVVGMLINGFLIITIVKYINDTKKER